MCFFRWTAAWVLVYSWMGCLPCLWFIFIFQCCTEADKTEKRTSVSAASPFPPSQWGWPPASPQQTHLQILKDYDSQRLQRLWQVTETRTTIWAWIYTVSHISFLPCPFISFLWENTFVSVRVQQVYYGCVGLVLAAHLGHIHRHNVVWTLQFFLFQFV